MVLGSCLTQVLILAGLAAQGPQEAGGNLVFSCEERNDLYRLLCEAGLNPPRFSSATDAIEQAEEGAGVLILADGYPRETTSMDQALFDKAATKGLRLYIEFPAYIPGIACDPPRDATLERGVVASDLFGDPLCPMRIVMINGCRYVPVDAGRPHLLLARVAGVDTAVFGLDDTETAPLLFEHPNGNVLVATTKLSHFVTGRYMPEDAWAVIWKRILEWVQPGAEDPELHWTPAVRPSYTRNEPLPENAEAEALRRCAQWFVNSRILRHPDWPKDALDLSLTYNTVRELPAADWPVGDGSLGLLEGFSSTIRFDGSQPMRYAVRNDCMSEVAMALAFDSAFNERPTSAETATTLLDYALFESPLTEGSKRGPRSPSYGLVGWALDHPNNFWGDDNARAMLGVMATSVLLDESKWDAPLVRCLLANLRTTGAEGFREECVVDEKLQARGWQSYWNGDLHKYSPHYESWLWTCFLWAYDKTGFDPFLDRSRDGVHALMDAYPDNWYWCNRSGAIERARALLPLAWLVRVDDRPQHREWLHTVAEDLAELQDESGAIRETIGDDGQGTASNAEYGTRETSLIQENGDPVADLLYTCNFALIGLHEAAAATGEPFYKELEDTLASFLCRIQIRSEAHPELDGAWYRAFNFERWEYWASNADWEWGPWCTESGWTQPWIASTLALRQMDTSLWELTADSRVRDIFGEYREKMLPQE
ncbi:MAG: hypothetical protein GY851_33800 [bacterium]|nr:hypothetical protein [bacterium]